MISKRVLTLWVDNKINQEDEDILRKPSKDITVPFDAGAQNDIKTVVEAFLERNDALGLAAPQIGINRKVIVFRNKGFEEKTWSKEKPDYDVLINPEITSTRGEKVKGVEGCLSCPDIQVEIERFPEIKVRAFNMEGKKINKRYVDFLARIVQHEMDHLEGILIVDYEGDIFFPSKKRSFFEGLFKPE